MENRKPLCVHIPIPFAQKPCLLNDKNSILDVYLGTRKGYLNAMERELRAAAQDMDDYEVVGIVFDTGAIQQFFADEAAELVGAIRSCLHVAKDAGLVLACDVNGLDPQKAGIYREMGATLMDIRLYTSVREECRAIGRPYPHFTLREPVQLLRSCGLEHIGAQVAVGIPDQTEESLMVTLRECVEYGAVHVTVLCRPGGQALADCADGFLAAHGYRCYAPGLYAVQGWEMSFYPPGKTEVLALGVGAQSRIDGVITTNTRDMKLYLRYAQDFRMIIESVKAEGPMGQR